MQVAANPASSCDSSQKMTFHYGRATGRLKSPKTPEDTGSPALRVGDDLECIVVIQVVAQVRQVLSSVDRQHARNCGVLEITEDDEQHPGTAF